MTNLIWMHEDALRVDHPVFEVAGEGAIAAFIWDEVYLKKMDYSFKRLVFVYERLCELPVEIYKGSTAEVLDALDPEYIYAAKTPNPILQTLAGREVQWVKEEPFAILKKEPELKRFFRYWNKAKKSAMQLNAGREHA